MGKIDEYRQILRDLDDWQPYLLKESRLPGPRANLELAHAVALEGDASLFVRFAAMAEEKAPVNSQWEFLAFCGVLGLGYLVSKGQTQHLQLLREAASDGRWRIREAVALGLQQFGKRDLRGLLSEMASWSRGTLLERRAVVATLCEPSLLTVPDHAITIFSYLDRITQSVLEVENRRSVNFRTLRKTLGYGWSVAVACQPSIGKPRMEKWVGCPDKDIRWIMIQNLKKKRLTKVEASWTSSQLKRLT